MADNQITVIGTLTRDPELRYTSGGMGLANFSVAYSKRKFNKETDSWEDGPTSFFDCTAWRDLGEHVAESLTKGMRVIVVGQMEQHFWETNEGEKRSKWQINVDEVGPSLRWATTTVQKTTREKAQPAPSAAPAPVYGDEEPF
jgi:single-strand DNA-binding protein